MDKEFYVIFIQHRFKYKLFLKQKIENKYKKFYYFIQNVMETNNKSYNLKLINTIKYNSNNDRLLQILEIYNKIETLTLNNKLIELNKLNLKLKELIKTTGTKIEDILSIFFEISISDLFSNIKIVNSIKYFNSVFNSISCDIYDPNNKNISELNITNFFLTKMKQPINNLIKIVNGAKLYIKINQVNKICIICGYFNTDPLNLSKNNIIFKDKNNNLEKKNKLLEIEKTFKNKYIIQLSLRDFVVLTPEEILTNITKKYSQILELKKKNISTVVKEFLNSSIEYQRDIIISLFIVNDIELQYIGKILYDLICNDSYYLKSQPLSNEIYTSLHWSIQKLINNSPNENNIVHKNIDTTKISYEKRITVLKTNHHIKNIAFEKLKDINNNSGDTGSKSQHYLDSLLKIPFNIFKEEKIFSKLFELKNKINQFIKIENLYDKNKNKNKNKKDTLFKPINLNISFFDTIDKLLTDLHYNNENLFITNYYKNTSLQNIKLLIKIFILKNKNIELINFFEEINISLEDKFKIKCTKKIYINQLIKFFNNNQYSDLLKETIFNKIYMIVSSYNNNYIIDNSYSTKFNKLMDEWNYYKKERKDYILNVDTILNSAIYSQKTAKKEIKRIIAQWINGKNTGYCLGFEGPPGIGKTSLAKKGISKCLIDDNGETRPFYFIALGGATNGSILEGHSYTYVGSTYGKIVEILIETQCMNPIIYIDELDKISNTDNGNEIISILTHITDPSQNDEFVDKYFTGIKFDLSKVLFIFSYNDYNKLDKILADRIHRIKFNYLSVKEKINIMLNYIIPELLENVGFSKDSIIFTEDLLEYIIIKYTYEAGVRKLKEYVFEIIRDINLNLILEEKSITKIKITKSLINTIFENKSMINHKLINNKNYIGIVNGLFATTMGIGGITPIQAFKTFSDTKLSLIMTGQQGDVMKESIQCAKTIAWNIIPNTLKKSIKKNLETDSFGIHIHCPEASTPKDGPSAGGAITLAIISLLCNIKVINNIAMTGEIDLNGDIHMIGGLDLKIEGGINAGIDTFLIPEENRFDLEIIKKEKGYLFQNITIIFINNIHEILINSLVDNKYFN